MRRATDRRFSLFPVPLWMGNFCDSGLLQNAERLAYEFQNGKKESGIVSDGWDDGKKSDDINIFREKGVTSFYNFSLTDLPEWQGIVTALTVLSSELLSDEWDASHLRIDNMWVTIYPRGAYVTEHIHSPYVLSGVFYVKAPEDCGAIVFKDPAWVAKVQQGQNGLGTFPIDGTRQPIEPTTGDLLLFPGWLPHYTKPNESEDDRIIVSFNMAFNKLPERLH